MHSGVVVPYLDSSLKFADSDVERVCDLSALD